MIKACTPYSELDMVDELHSWFQHEAGVILLVTCTFVRSQRRGVGCTPLLLRTWKVVMFRKKVVHLHKTQYLRDMCCCIFITMREQKGVSVSHCSQYVLTCL